MADRDRSVRIVRSPAPALGESYHVEVIVGFEEGGINYFHGGTNRRGFYVAVHPVMVKDGFVSFLLGGGPAGGKMCIEPAPRFNAKKLAQFVDLVTPRAELAVALTCVGQVRDALHYLKTGIAPGVIAAPAPVELPADAPAL